MIDWLDELSQLHKEDKRKRREEAKTAERLDMSLLKQPRHAADLLRQCEAHTLLRRVQNALLGGKGLIDFFEHAGKYERVITLVWQGPISAARNPDPQDPEDYQYIAVGVSKGQVYVNGKILEPVIPETLKVALVAASKNPARQHPARRGKKKP